MLPAPEDLAKHDGLPSWLQLGLMKYASRSKIDRDELFYCSDLVRKNGGKYSTTASGSAVVLFVLLLLFGNCVASCSDSVAVPDYCCVTEFFVDFSCYSEYFSNADVTLVSGSSDLQATR